MKYYLMGLTMGLAYVAPIGMQNLFVINSALSQKRGRAYLTSLIVTFWDISLALACFFGVGGIIDKSTLVKDAVMLIGGLVVVWIGVGLMRDKGEMKDVDMNIPLKKIITGAFAVTWLNPQALIDGSLLIGGTRASLPDGVDLNFILGFMSASILWFNGMSTVLQIFSGKFTPKVLRAINLICGAVIIFYGLKLIYSFVITVI